MADLDGIVHPLVGSYAVLFAVLKPLLLCVNPGDHLRLVAPDDLMSAASLLGSCISLMLLAAINSPRHLQLKNVGRLPAVRELC